MDETAIVANGFGQPGEEGDDVVARGALDFVDAFDVGGADGGELGAAFFADGAGGGGGDVAVEGHAFGGQGLDLEPDAVAVLGRPDRGHGGAGIAGHHGCGLLAAAVSPV